MSAGIQAHGTEANQDAEGGNQEDDLPLADDLEIVSRSSLAVKARIFGAQRIEDIHQCPGHEKRREHGQNDTDGQRLGKTLDGTGAQEEQDRGCDQGSHVTVDDSGQSLVKTDTDRAFYVGSGGYFFTDTCENNNIRVNCHTDGQQDTRDAGQGQGHVKAVQDKGDQDDIDSQCHAGQETGQQVHDDHEDCYGGETDQTCRLGGLDGVLSQLGTDDLGTEPGQLDLQSADSDGGSQGPGRFDGFFTLNDGAAVGNDRVYLGNADELAIIVNTDGLAFFVCPCSRFRELLGTFIRKGQLDNDLLVVHVVSGIARFRVGYVCTVDNDLAGLFTFFQSFGQDISVGPVFLGSLLIVLIAFIIRLTDKIKGTGPAQLLKDRVGLGNAADSGDLNIDPVITFLIYNCFCGVLLNTLLQLVDGITHVLLAGGLFAGSLVGDAGAAREVEAQLDIVIGTLPAASEAEKGGKTEQSDQDCNHNK